LIVVLSSENVPSEQINCIVLPSIGFGVEIIGNLADGILRVGLGDDKDGAPGLV
jgi:hypothetical protein